MKIIVAYFYGYKIHYGASLIRPVRLIGQTYGPY
jgi:hypothetical protein